MGYFLIGFTFVGLGILFSILYHRVFFGLNISKRKTAIEGMMLGTIVGCIAILVFGFMAEMDMIGLTEYELVERVEVIAIEDGMTKSGLTIFGTGRKREDPRIYYMVETHYGIESNHVRKRDAYIVETDDEVPNISSYEKRFSSDWMYKLFPLTFTRTFHVVTVPEGTVSRGFNIDLKQLHTGDSE